MKEIKLFDYQQEMLENITEVFSAAVFDSVLYNEKGKRVNVGSSVMVQMPTGTGKTYVMAAVVRWFLETYSKGEVWLIAHRKELVEQMEQTLDRFALDYGEKDDELTAKVRIRVLSIQWLTRNIGDLEKNGFRPGLIIVDEAHHLEAATTDEMSFFLSGCVYPKPQSLEDWHDGNALSYEAGFVWHVVQPFDYFAFHKGFYYAWVFGSL